MFKINKQVGSAQSFDQNWANRNEAKLNHWISGEPENQVQLAFRMHWNLFKQLLDEPNNDYKSCLEVGCGRGTISSYFSSAGYECTLLDSSQNAIALAKSIFEQMGQTATFIRDDANAMPFAQDSFDVVVSIGLLEHFEEISKPIKEQVRVLKKGGACLMYIVPHREDNIQKYFKYVNQVISTLARVFKINLNEVPKSEIYRNNLDSSAYINILKEENIKDFTVYGVYPLPMISTSPHFPFTLLPKSLEYIVVKIFIIVLYVRKLLFLKNPWICREKLGQAFLIFFKK